MQDVLEYQQMKNISGSNKASILIKSISLITHPQIGAEEDSKSSKWITLDQNLDLYANHENIIEKVCFHRNAYCPITDEPDTVEEGKKLLKKKSSLWGVFLSPENTDEADA